MTDEVTPAEPPQPNGFFIGIEEDADGNLSTSLTALGDRRITEAPVFLKKALAVVNSRLGID